MTKTLEKKQDEELIMDSEDNNTEISYTQVFPKSVQPGIPKLKDLPLGWKAVKLGNVLKVVTRPAKLDDNTVYQLVTAKRSREGIVSRGQLPGNKIRVKTQFYIKSGDFLISRRQIVHGGCGIVPQELDDAIVSNEYLVCQATNDLLQEYLNWMSHTIYFQQTCFHGSIGVHVEKMVFKPDWWFKYKFHIPPIPEQQQIADILTCWDGAIEKTENLIEAKTQLKKGLMQKLLTGKVRFKEFVKEDGFKKTKIGLVPNDWEVNKFYEIGKLQGGYAFKSDDSQQNGIKWLKIANVTFGKIDWQVKSYLPCSYLEEYKDYILKENDIVLAMTRPLLGNNLKIAKILKMDANSLLNQRVGRLFLKQNNVDNNFIFYLVQSQQFIKNIQSKLFGTDPPNISSEMFENNNIALPIFNEQQKIASVLTTCDKEIETLNKQLEALKKEKKGLMQKLLTGQVRVKVGA